MNTKEYIESGMLEQYVMGTLSAQEKQEVECMSHIYPEIATELLSVQNTMEAFAKSISKTPPAHLRDQILGSIHELAMSEENETVQTPISNTTTTITNQQSSPSDTLSKSNTFTVRYNMMRVAASILFIAGLVMAYQLYKNNDVRIEQQNQLASIQKELADKSNLISLQQQQLAVIQNDDYQKIALNGIPAKSPTSQATIYWNKKSKDVYLSIANLPAPSADKQYQLWAIADGKPVDMGMLNEDSLSTLFQKMKTIDQAQAFAITLEKKGGVASPTLSEMYVMGGV